MANQTERESSSPDYLQSRNTSSLTLVLQHRVTLFTYPHFKGQYKKFRVFSNHCYLPPRKLRNAVKSLIISDKIDSCTFWSEPGCKGEPYWLPAGKIEDLKGEGRGFVSFQCLLVGESDGDGNDEAEAEAEGEELKKREGSTHY